MPPKSNQYRPTRLRKAAANQRRARLNQQGRKAKTIAVRGKSARFRVMSPLKSSLSVATPSLGALAASYAGSHRKPFFRMVSSGDDLIVHACDRIQPVSMDTRTLSVAAANLSGNVLLTARLNPTNLGERLRRLASCFENFSFQSCVVHYQGARGSGAVGSLLGFYDQDPADDFLSGSSSLLEAAAHPGAHSIKVWEEGAWIMPPRLGGRFYVEANDDTAAGKRLTEQGVFRIMVDVPLDASAVAAATVNILGSTYIEYVCKLTKPTIQPQFVGTADRFFASPFPSALTMDSNNHLQQLLTFAPFVIPRGDMRNNGGVEFRQNAITGLHAGAAWAVPEGVWAINVRMNVFQVLTPVTCSLFPVAASTFAGTAVVGNTGIGPGFANIFSDDINLDYGVVGTLATGTVMNFGWCMTVPHGQFRYLTMAGDITAGTCTYSGMQWSFTLMLPSPEDEAFVRPTALSLGERMLRLETKDEGKEELISDIEDIRPAPKRAATPVGDSGIGSSTVPPTHRKRAGVIALTT